ncbi:MAG TPA: nucleotidyltransferase family protein [Pyrinomonadaceae bacterium]|nr:nucleotidyltransferase family protein [Pyrinomonadaceae bacterium]
MNDVAAILLAAGRSRRMGAFKPLLPFGGGTVIAACVASLRGAGVAEVLVVVGHRGEELKEALAGESGVRFASNEEAGSEMGASIARGVEALGEEVGAVLIALVDYPAVPPVAIRRLLEARARTGARLFVPEWEGRGGHPVLVDMSFREELLGLDARGGLRALFAAHRGEVLRVPVGSPFVTRDMDTWEDYRALHEEVFGSPPPDSAAS